MANVLEELVSYIRRFDFVCHGSIAVNFLEQLIAEWSAYGRNCFVRTNVNFGPRPLGGFEGEMDVVAFEPNEKLLFHVEASSDADSWDERRERFQRKFIGAAKYYDSLFTFEKKQKVTKVAVVGPKEPEKSVSFGDDIELWSVRKLMQEITEQLPKDPFHKAVPECYPLLRAVQFANWFHNTTKTIPIAR